MFFGRIILTKKELDTRLHKAFFEGYERGIDAGKQLAYFEKVTLNSFREALSLPPITKKEN